MLTGEKDKQIGAKLLVECWDPACLVRVYDKFGGNYICFWLVSWLKEEI